MKTYATVWKKIEKVGFTDRELTDLPSREAVKAWLADMPPAAAEQAALRYKAILNHAYDIGYFADPPYGGRGFLSGKKRHKKRMVWNQLDLARAILRMEGHRLEGYVLVMAGAGLRKEEALDIDIEKDIEIEERKHGKHIVWLNIDSAFTAHDGAKGTKNEESVRRIPITGEIAERLVVWLDGRTGYLVQNLQGGRLGVTGLRKTFGLLFRGEIQKKPGVRGSYYKPPAPLHTFKRITPNQMRHIHITMMEKLTVTETVVSKYHGQVPKSIAGSAYFQETWHDEAYVAAADLFAKSMKKAFKKAHKMEDANHGNHLKPPNEGV